MKGWVIAVTLGGLATAALAVAALMETTPAAKPPINPKLVTFTQGNRYSVTLTCPGIQLPPPVPGFLGVGPTSIVSVSPDPTTTPSSESWTVILDFTGPTVTVPELVPGNGTGCSSTVADLGPSTIGGVSAQHVAVYWGKTSSASKSRPAIVTAPSDIFSVDMGLTGTVTMSGRVATLKLNGTPGTVTVWASDPHGHNINPLKATVLVS
jgi:hypothetical protein